MKAKKIIIAVVAVLVVLGGTFAGLWFFTGVFNFLKPANDVFSNQIEKALNLEGAKFSNYSNFLKEYKEISGKSYKSKFNVSANVNVKNVDSDVKNVINKSKLTIESSADISNKKTQSKVGLYSNNSEVLTLDLVTNDTTLGLGCKDLSDKYYTVKVEDFIEYLKKNSSSSLSKSDLKAIEAIEKSLSGSSSINTYDLLYISDKDLKHFDDTYRNCLTTLISKDCYSSEKDVKVEVDGDDEKTTAYYLTLTGADAYKFVEDFTNLAKNDSVLISIITEKANMVLESAGQSKIDEDTVKDALANLSDNLLEELESIKDEKDSAVQIAVYSSKNKPVRIDVNTIEDVDKKDDKETIFSIEYADSKTIYTVYNNGKSYITVTDEYKKEKNSRSGKLTAKSSGMSIGTLDYEFVKKDNESKIDLALNVPLAGLSADVELSTKGNYKKEPVDVNARVNVVYGSQSVEVKLDGSVEYGDVSIPTLSSSNSIDVLKLSNDQLKTELNKVLKKASEVLPSRLKLIGVNIKAEDIYKAPTLETTTTDTTKTESSDSTAHTIITPNDAD